MDAQLPRSEDLSDTSNTAARSIRGANVTTGDNDAEPASPRDSGHLILQGHNESPLSRAGLLQPKSFMSFQSRSSRHFLRHDQESIRDSTMQLSSLSIKSPLSARSSDSFIFPTTSLQVPATVAEDHASIVASLSSAITTDSTSEDLFSSTATLSSTNTTGPRAHGRPGTSQPSGLSLLRPPQTQDDVSTSPTSEGSLATPTQEYPNPISHRRPAPPTPLAADNSTDSTPSITQESHRRFSERSHLLGDVEALRTSYTANGHTPNTNGHVQPEAVGKHTSKGSLAGWGQHLLKRTHADELKHVPTLAVKSLPAVVLGTLLNILDGISYGMIAFPAAGVFTGLGGVGVSMFFVSAIISQLVYSFGGSGFAGANGSMMIEVVPFFHILANDIASQIGEEHPHEIIATTIIAFALSSLLTGLTFFLLGALRLGSLIGFFPRHILVGCIGGVGVFLIITGLTVSTRMDDDEFSLSFETFKYLCLNLHNLILWLPAFVLAVLLRVITHKYHHQLIFPLYFITIPIIFYAVAAAAHLNLGKLRADGWLFDMDTADDPWWRFYTFYDFSATRWSVLWSTLPTQFALLFFNILHPPLNVPALAVSLNHDVDTDKELVAHGYSNLLAGVFGTVPNYLVYVNTLLFYRVGGDNRVAGFMLAAATAVLLFVGTGPIAYIPVMVVGALIFVLGIDLVKEALWDTRHRVNWSEYVTILSIMICMTIWDFVIGVLFGIVVSCFFFVVQSSRRQSIRALHTGETVMSTVRRPGSHRAYIREVSKQTTVMRLQGFLFFGTITHVEETMRTLVQDAYWQNSPIRFLVLDLSLVAGVDMSAAEAFVRIQRFLSAKQVVLVFCGFEAETPVGRALTSVDLLEMDGVELFSTFNDALEWTENAYLRAWFDSQKVKSQAVTLPGRQGGIMLRDDFGTSPRMSRLLAAGWETIARDTSPEVALNENAEPFATLAKTLSAYGEVDKDHFQPIVSYLERMSLPEGYVLWTQDDEPDGLYLIESGVLRAVYHFAEHTPDTEESMVAGTIAGELSALSETSRNATCIVERPAVVWKLGVHALRRMETEHPELARTFTKLLLKAAKLDYDILLSALATRQ